MKAALADSNCFPLFGRLHFHFTGAERTASVSSFVFGTDDVALALAESSSPSTQIARFHKNGDPNE
jgi:hypothetical protein